MQVKTNKPISENPSSITSEIAYFWNKVSSGWLTIWGPHIHHGFYDVLDKASPIEAQEKLLDKISALLKIQPNAKILDVGCGLGGSSRYLAQKFSAQVTGITLSTSQIKLAEKETPPSLFNKINYIVEDAHNLRRFPENYFDIVWALESCEQFYDKAKFIRESLRVLKPNGKLMIATWCSDQENYSGKQARDYLKLCKNFQLPYMPSIDYYEKTLNQKANLLATYDWSDNVKQSWEIGLGHLKQFSWLKLLKLGGLTGIRFVRNLKLMNHAFKTGQLRYGVFVVCKTK